MKSFLKIVACALLIFFSIVCLVIAGAIYWHDRSFVVSALRADGAVTSVVEKRADRSSVFYPVFTFNDVNGLKHKITSSSGRNPPSFRVGDKVTVLYQPNNPDNAKLDSFLELWGVSALVGSLFLSLGLFTMGFLLVICYLLSVFRLIGSLRANEPDLWESLGRPSSSPFSMSSDVSNPFRIFLSLLNYCAWFLSGAKGVQHPPTRDLVRKTWLWFILSLIGFAANLLSFLLIFSLFGEVR